MNKYIDSTGEMLNCIAGNGFLDDECGDTDEFGRWYGLILEHKAIITEDDQGFFHYELFNTEQEAQKLFNIIQDELYRDLDSIEEV